MEDNRYTSPDIDSESLEEPESQAIELSYIGSPLDGVDEDTLNDLVSLTRFLDGPLLCINADIDEATFQWVVRICQSLEEGSPISVLIESPGGDAAAAYRIARLLQAHCKWFEVIVPRFAKSAATILALGAEKIWMGRLGELGPIDAQILDFERETIWSALNTVGALDALHSFALDALDMTVVRFHLSSRKRIDTVLPHAINLVCGLMQPLMSNIDIGEYASHARALEIAREYGRRLLRSKVENVEFVVHRLIEAYPEHGFVIDCDEAQSLGLPAEAAPREIQALLERIQAGLAFSEFVGCLQFSTEDGVDDDDTNETDARTECSESEILSIEDSNDGTIPRLELSQSEEDQDHQHSNVSSSSHPGSEDDSSHQQGHGIDFTCTDLQESVQAQPQDPDKS